MTERTMRFGDTLGQDLMLPKKEVKVSECLDSVVISARRLWRPREHGMSKVDGGLCHRKEGETGNSEKANVEVKWGEAREAQLKGSRPPKGCGASSLGSPITTPP